MDRVAAVTTNHLQSAIWSTSNRSQATVGVVWPCVWQLKYAVRRKLWLISELCFFCCWMNFFLPLLIRKPGPDQIADIVWMRVALEQTSLFGPIANRSLYSTRGKVNQCWWKVILFDSLSMSMRISFPKRRDFIKISNASWFPPPPLFKLQKTVFLVNSNNKNSSYLHAK